MSQLKHHDSKSEDRLTIELPSIGVGTMRTSATYIAVLVQFEGTREEQIDVLDSAMEALGIDPREVLHNRKQPDVCDTDERAKWEEEARVLADLAQSRGKG